ncbi:MAG: zinc metalloprotease [Bacteroidetes bacterium]|nr:MAG: zinc metalloprotease [Bacteroidota bacterium]
MKRLLLLIILLSVLGLAKAQNHRTCGTVTNQKALEAKYPDLKSKQDLQEKELQKWIHNPKTQKDNDVIIIPVVVHILYNNNYQNISDAQIQSQIDVLNRDYRRLNADTINTPSLFDSVAADVGIEFCFAHQDPNGNWTNGVTRTQTSKTIFDLYADDAKFTSQGGIDAWDRDKYYNIWVVPSIKAGTETGILGYAQMPGGPPATDGVVVEFRYFGDTLNVSPPYDKGRTLTHETGHWLSLYHIWGDDGYSCSGSDFVEDTPNQGGENYACPSFPHPSCNNTSDMFMNYMDYTNDACMNMFTYGQKQRMIGVLNSSRASLKTSGMCQIVSIPETSTLEHVKIYPNPSSGNFVIDFSDIDLQSDASVKVYNMMGQLVYSNTFSAHSAKEKIMIPNVDSGVYMLHIDTQESNIIKKIEVHK